MTLASLEELRASVEAQARNRQTQPWGMNLSAFRWLVSQSETRPGVLKANCHGHDLTVVGRRRGLLRVGVAKATSEWEFVPDSFQNWSWARMLASLDDSSLKAVVFKSDVRYFGLAPWQGYDHGRQRWAQANGVELPVDARPWFFHLVRGNGEEVLFSIGEVPWTAAVTRKGRWSPGGVPLWVDVAAVAASPVGGAAVPTPAAVPRLARDWLGSEGRGPDLAPDDTESSVDALQRCNPNCEIAGCAACFALQHGRGGGAVPPAVPVKAAPVRGGGAVPPQAAPQPRQPESAVPGPAPAAERDGGGFPAPFKAPPGPAPAADRGGGGSPALFKAPPAAGPPPLRQSAVAETNAPFRATPRPDERAVPRPQFKAPPRPASPREVESAVAEPEAVSKAPPRPAPPSPPPRPPPPPLPSAVAEPKARGKAPPRPAPPPRPPPPPLPRLTIEEWKGLPLGERPRGRLTFVKAPPAVLRRPEPQPSVEEPPRPQPSFAASAGPRPLEEDSPETSDEEEISSQAQTPR